VIDHSTSERDALMEAIARAQQEIGSAETAKKVAEERITALQARIDTQHVRFVFLQSRLEKMGVQIGSWDEDQDKRIKLLESQYEQYLAENQRLRELLRESVAGKVSSSAPETTSTPVEQSDPAPLDANSPIEIDASPRHPKSYRG